MTDEAREETKVIKRCEMIAPEETASGLDGGQVDVPREMPALALADILDVDDLVVQKVTIPEWNGTVCIRVVSGAERDRFEAFCQRKKFDNFRAHFAAMVLCDEAGDKLITSEGLERQLAKKNARALDRIMVAGMQLNGITAEEVAELEGN